MELVGQDEAGVVVHHRDQVIEAPADHPEVRGVSGPHLVRPAGLAVVLLAGLELHLGRLDQTLSTKDAIDGGHGDGEALAVCEPRSQLATAQLY